MWCQPNHFSVLFSRLLEQQLLWRSLLGRLKTRVAWPTDQRSSATGASNGASGHLPVGWGHCAWDSIWRCEEVTVVEHSPDLPGLRCSSDVKETF